MRREYIIAFLLMLASIPAGVAVNAGADYFPALHAYSGKALLVSVFIMTLLLVAAVIIAIRGERNAEREGKERRMIPFVGMIFCGLGFVAFGTWYFWPAARPFETVASSPLNDVVPSQTKETTKPTVPKQVSLLWECEWMPMPSVIPDGGRINKIQASIHGGNTPSVGFGSQSGQPGSPSGWDKTGANFLAQRAR
jgi:hypothetical protein